MTTRDAARPPIIWFIGGLDTAGGAGLSADQRAADALGAHACPIAACLTAQHSQGVAVVQPVATDMLEAQLLALAEDMPPEVIKTGLLGSVDTIERIAAWVDRLRASRGDGRPALVVDPVLRASAGGAAFSNEAIVAAYRQHLLPRATVITPNRAEARQLLAWPDDAVMDAPAMSRAFLAHGCGSVLITGGDGRELPPDNHHSVDWLHTPQTHGWLCAPRVDTPHHHGTGCTLASAIAAALALGHHAADACVLGRMVVHHALMHSHPAGHGRGPVIARPDALVGVRHGGAPMPWLGIGTDWPWRLQADDSDGDTAARDFAPFPAPRDGLYGIRADGPAVAASVEAGLRCVQLRHKPHAGLADAIAQSLQAASQHGASLFINDHWEAALQTPLPAQPATGFALGVHLGQEDLQALTPEQTQHLRARRGQLMLGLSSHCPWELARALGCGPSYVACGPVQATTTKDMPWVPQGATNLRWWVAQSDLPVVAIGGLLTADDLRRFSHAGAAALCVVRALDGPTATLPERLRTLRTALSDRAKPGDGTANTPFGIAPHPCLPP